MKVEFSEISSAFDFVNLAGQWSMWHIWIQRAAKSIGIPR